MLCKLDYIIDNLMDSLGERKDNLFKIRENWGEWFLLVSVCIKLFVLLCILNFMNFNCVIRLCDYIEIRVWLIICFL